MYKGDFVSLPIIENMRIKYILLYLLIGTGLLTSCAPTIEPPVDMGYNYIPIDTGRYYIYDVDSIYIDIIADPDINDTTHYQIKETYPSTFIDGMGETAINVTRYYRSDSTQAWVLMTPDVWWLKRTTTRLEKREENLTFVKMTYPIDKTYTWDGNAYNTLGTQDYYYGDEDISFDNGFELFDSTITVYQQFDTSSLIQYYLFTETYARNRGMVHKFEINITDLILDTTEISPWPYPGLNWYMVPKLKRIRTGSWVEYKLIDDGFE